MVGAYDYHYLSKHKLAGQRCKNEICIERCFQLTRIRSSKQIEWEFRLSPNPKRISLALVEPVSPNSWMISPQSPSSVLISGLGSEHTPARNSIPIWLSGLLALVRRVNPYQKAYLTPLHNLPDPVSIDCQFFASFVYEPYPSPRQKTQRLLLYVTLYFDNLHPQLNSF